MVQDIRWINKCNTLCGHNSANTFGGWLCHQSGVIYFPNLKVLCINDCVGLHGKTFYSTVPVNTWDTPFFLGLLVMNFQKAGLVMQSDFKLQMQML